MSQSTSLSTVIHMQDPWYEFVTRGKKTVEGKVWPEERGNELVGETVEFTNGEQSVLAKITASRHYHTLQQYLEGEGWQRCAPHAGDLSRAHELYLRVVKPDGEQVFASARVAERGGICALQLELVE